MHAGKFLDCFFVVCGVRNMTPFYTSCQGCTPGLSRDLCATWSHVGRLSATDSMMYELQDRAGQLRARVALFERPEGLLMRGAAAAASVRREANQWTSIVRFKRMSHAYGDLQREISCCEGL